MAYTTINKSTDYFDTKLYTGNGGTLNVTGLEFQPDFSWLKCRSIGYYHRWYDAVRGVTKSIRSDGTFAEATNAGEGITAFNSDGYTVIQGSNTEYNNNNVPYASWNWKAGTTGSGNTTGSGSYKTYSYSVNTTAGFSIVKYVGNGSAGHTIPHHLGVAPKMVAIKNLSDGQSWRVGFTTLGFSKYLAFNNSDAQASNSVMFNNTDPTSSVFTLGSDGSTNANNENFIAYCFAEKTGYSKFGSYTGNGNADGSFIYTGFKPAFIMIKRSDSADNWYIKDNKRSGTAALQNFGQMNPNQTQHPSANNTNVENKASAFATDILSNGFKLRGTDAGINASGGTYIYMCFAEAPLVGSNNVPCTAR